MLVQTQIRATSTRPPAPLKHTATPAHVDASTINRAKLGDAEAFTALVEAYYARCLRFAGSMLRNPSDAEDIVQETFARVYGALPRYQERRRFEAWLFQILGNCCRNANASAHARVSRSLDEMRGAERLPAPPAPPGARGDWGDAVRRALAAVPEYNREVFLLHYVDGFSYEEIESMTGVRKSALKMRAKRAADQLRASLGSRERAYE